MLARGANRMDRCHANMTILHWAVSSWKIETIHYLINEGFSIESEVKEKSILGNAPSVGHAVKVINWAIMRPFFASLKQKGVALPPVIRKKIAVKVYVDLMNSDKLRAHLETKKLHALYDDWTSVGLRTEREDAGHSE